MHAFCSSSWRLPVLVSCSMSLLACRDAPVGHRQVTPFAPFEALPTCTPADTASERTRCPTEFTGLLDNPHQGFSSFYDYASDLPLSKHPAARVAYTRFWYSDLEPSSPGALDFTAIDQALSSAAANHQTFAFRIMPEESAPNARRVPQWLADLGGTWGTHNGVRYFSPDYNHEAVLQAIERSISALGARYDLNPVLDHVDVGFVGDTGEWSYVVDGASMPTEATAHRIIDAFTRAFPHTPVLMNVGSPDDGAKPLSYALSTGAGWRADCWGDLRAGWNHHDDFYEQQLGLANATEAWRTAPVAVETCADMELWKALGYDEAQVRWVLQWALDHHVSLINNKARAVPSEWRPLVDEYLTHAGYRFTVWQVRNQLAGRQVQVNASLFNRGTAPLYRAYRLAVRARVGESVRSTSIATTTLAKLPLGQLEVKLLVEVPADASNAELDLAIVDASGQPVIHLANEGERSDGWLPVSRL